MTLSHCLDGWVGVTNCDKITPGMLMAAGRLNLPALILTGGPMKANVVDGKLCHPIQGFGMVGQVKAGKKGDATLKRRRPCFFKGKFMDTPIYDGALLSPGNSIQGHAIVEEPTSTLVIPPGFTCTIDPYGNYLLKRGVPA
jgi:hypothetical protein